MIDAFIKALLPYDHIIDCVTELTKARKEGDKLKQMCLNTIFDYYMKEKGKWQKMELRRIETDKYELFVKLLNGERKLRPNEIAYKMKITKDDYDLYLNYHWNKSETKKKKAEIKKATETKRQNIQDGYLPWISKILRVS